MLGILFQQSILAYQAIKGQVTDTHGNIIVFARVQLLPTNKVTSAKNTGQFKFEQIEKGAYEVINFICRVQEPKAQNSNL